MHFSSLLVYFSAGLAAASVVSVKSSTTTTKSTTKSTSTTTAAAATSTCAAPFTSILQSEVAHPSYFCNFYLSNGLNQTLSASRYFSAEALTQACQDLVPKLQSQAALVPSVGQPVCDQVAYATIAKEFTKPSVLCQYWFAVPQKYLPLAALTTLTQISNGCRCVVASPLSSSTSTSVSKSASTAAPVVSTSKLATSATSLKTTAAALQCVTTQTTVNMITTQITTIQTATTLVNATLTTTVLATTTKTVTAVPSPSFTTAAVCSALSSTTIPPLSSSTIVTTPWALSPTTATTTETTTTPWTFSASTMYTTTTTVSTAGTTTTSTAPAPVPTVPESYSSPFYLRLTNSTWSQSASSDQFAHGGYWINPMAYLQDNENIGQYLAVTADPPQNPFVLGANNDLILINGTVTGRPGHMYTPNLGYYGGMFYLADFSTSSTVKWYWDTTTDAMTISGGKYQDFMTCEPDFHGSDKDELTWTSSTRPIQPLTIGWARYDGCVAWEMEIVPASEVTPDTPATTTAAAAQPTTATTGMSYSPPFYIQLSGLTSGSVPATANYTNYYLNPQAFTNPFGDVSEYLALTPTKPSTPFVLNQNGNLMQLAGTSWGTAGFATIRFSTDFVLGDAEIVYLTAGIALPPWDLTWSYKLVGSSIAMLHPLDDATDLVATPAMTCLTAAGATTYWNATMMAAPPLIMASYMISGCDSWNMRVVFA